MTEETSYLPTKEIIRRFIEARDNKWHDTVENVYHASSVYQCLREAWFRKQGEVPTETPPIGLYEMGRRVEAVLFEALQAFYGAKNVRNDLLVKFDAPGYVIVGESDPVLFDFNNKPKIVFECKSSAAGERSTAGMHHKLQAAIYAYLIGAPEIRIVQPNRNDVLDCGETVVGGPKDIEELWQTAMDYFEELHNLKELPPAIPKLDWQCDYCSFKSKCIEAGGWSKVERKITRGKNAGTSRVEWVRDSSRKDLDE